MDAPGIRQIIDAALQQERDTGQLRRQIGEQLPRLREKLVLPQQQPVDALMNFITGYIRSVPSCLQLVTAVSKQLGFFDYAAPFLHMAEDYFLQPPDDLSQTSGLEALLDEAFLAHRLLEEVNDHHIRHLDKPLLPLDMTEANIIVHHLLGDSFASRLEQLVQFTASQLLSREHIWQRVKSLSGSGTTGPLVSSQSITGTSAAIRLRMAS